MKAIDNALSDSEKNMITPNAVIESLIKQVKEQVVSEDDKERYLELIQKVIREEYLTILENEIAKAFITAYEEQARSLFDSYLDNAECYTNKTIVKDKITREDREPDEHFMKTIEEQIGITGTATDGFRSRDDDQKKKYNEMIKTMIEEYSYSENSAEEVLTYASNNLWRDS